MKIITRINSIIRDLDWMKQYKIVQSRTTVLNVSYFLSHRDLLYSYNGSESSWLVGFHSVE